MNNRLLDDRASDNARAVVPHEMQDLAREAKQRVQDAVKQAERFVKRHPLATLAAAVGAGVVLGWWIKRR